MESRIEDHESRFVRLESSIGQLQTDMNIVKSMLKKLVARDERKANGGKDLEEESLVINQGTDMDAIKAKFEKFMGRFQKEKKSNEDKEQETTIHQGTEKNQEIEDVVLEKQEVDVVSGMKDEIEDDIIPRMQDELDDDIIRVHRLEAKIDDEYTWKQFFNFKKISLLKEIN